MLNLQSIATLHNGGQPLSWGGQNDGPVKRFKLEFTSSKSPSRFPDENKSIVLFVLAIGAHRIDAP